MELPNITILDEKDKRLHQKSEEVTFPLDDEMIKTINDSLDYLEMSQDEELAKKYDLRAGMGLSMCQIGIMKRIFVVSEDNGDGTFERYVVINPKVLSHSEELIYVGEGEGCLSVNREVKGIVPRYARMKIKAYNEYGDEYIIRVREDISIAFQHEMDHLDGILFVDRIDSKNPFKNERNLKKLVQLVFSFVLFFVNKKDCYIISYPLLSIDIYINACFFTLIIISYEITSKPKSNLYSFAFSFF